MSEIEIILAIVLGILLLMDNIQWGLIGISQRNVIKRREKQLEDFQDREHLLVTRIDEQEVRITQQNNLLEMIQGEFIKEKMQIPTQTDK